MEPHVYTMFLIVTMNPLLVYARCGFKCQFPQRVSIAFYQILSESTVLKILNTLKGYTVIVFTI